MLDLARQLPEWFTAGGLEHMAVDFGFQHRRVAVGDDGQMLGFATFIVNEGIGRITWLGVRPDCHRSGIGRALALAIEKELADAGVQAVVVDTLGDSVDYEPYARTRAFYRALGYADQNRVFNDNPEYPEQLTLRKELLSA